MALLSDAQIKQHPIQQQEELSAGLYGTEGFYREKGEARETVTVKRHTYSWAWTSFSWGEKGFYYTDCPFFLEGGMGGGAKRARGRNYFTGAG